MALPSTKNFTDCYGVTWPSKPDALQIEFHQIRTHYFKKSPQLYQHYLNAHKLIWPHDKQHRWFVLGMRGICEHDVLALLGCASSNKTYLFVAHSLIDFWVFPTNSLAIISTTDIISLERKIWGRIKTMFNRGRSRYDWLAGYILDSKRQITPYEIDDDNEMARSLECGIGTVACVSGGRFVGMGKFQGSKPPHSEGKFDGILKHYGDEAAVMQPSFLDAYANWMVNNSGPVKSFKGCMAGNPTDISDPLCMAAEPVGGWDTFVDTGKTQEWTSRWYDAHVIAFDGRDSPNNDEPKNSFPFLVSENFVELMRKTHGDDSWQFYQQAIGKPSKGMVSNRVITIGLCERNKAFDDVIWQDGDFTHLYSLDPAFGGADRCVGMELKFGPDLTGKQILSISEPEIIPIRLNAGLEPEEQIARFIKMKSDQLNITASNIFYDSFGGGLLGFSFAKVFGSNCPVPVNSGDSTSARPVRFDLFVTDSNGRKRLKRCDEEYSKFVTEMWFSTREAIESGQIRNLPKSVAHEGQLRLYSIVKGNKTEVESKDDMKERVKKSPDLYDCFAIGVEGARRLGFKIQRLGLDVEPKKPESNWLKKQSENYQSMIKSKQLQHA